MRVMFIGQAQDFKPGPILGERCGRRLAKLMGIPPSEFRKRFRLVNLLPVFPGRAAKGDLFSMQRVRIVIRRTKLRGRTILVGRNVASAFGLKRAPFLLWFNFKGTAVAVIPHPSGICRWWNNPTNVARAKRFLRPLAK